MLQFFLRAASGNADPRIPVGGVLLWEGGAAPAGWAAYGDDNFALTGAPTAGLAGTVKSLQSQLTLTGATDVAGAHTGTTEFLAVGDPTLLFSPSGQYYRATTSAGAHTHGLSTTVPYNPAYVKYPLIQKTGDKGAVPAGASVLAPGALPSAAFDVIADHIGKVLYSAGGALASVAANVPTSFSASTDSAGAHGHGSQSVTTDPIGSTFGPAAYSHLNAGSHAHPVTGAIDSIGLPVYRLAQHRAITAAGAPLGAVIAFDGDAGDVTDGWRFCDGSNGTLDLRDKYLEFSAVGDVGAAGDGTVAWSLTTMTSAGAHQHRGANQGNVEGFGLDHSDTAGAHVHAFPTRGGSVSLRSKYIRFIQFLP